VTRRVSFRVTEEDFKTARRVAERAKTEVYDHIRALLLSHLRLVETPEPSVLGGAGLTRRVSFFVSDEDYEALTRVAVRTGAKPSAYARSVLHEELRLAEWAEESALDTPPEDDEQRMALPTLPPNSEFE